MNISSNLINIFYFIANGISITHNSLNLYSLFLNMKFTCRKAVLFFILLIPLVITAQEQQSSKDKAPASTHAQRKVARQKWKEQRKLEIEQKKAVKEHDKRLQTKKTRKEMRKEKRKGEKLRANKKEFFLIRWFKYRRH
jgi:hypothetical protein